MKGIWYWLKSSSKMKRWIFLILVGIVLTCYGIAKILVQKEMEIAVPTLIILFIVALIIVPYLLDAWFMEETDKLMWKKDEEKNNEKGEK